METHAELGGIRGMGSLNIGSGGKLVVCITIEPEVGVDGTRDVEVAKSILDELKTKLA